MIDRFSGLKLMSLKALSSNLYYSAASGACDQLRREEVLSDIVE